MLLKHNKNIQILIVRTVQDRARQDSAGQYITLQYSTVQYSTVQYSAKKEEQQLGKPQYCETGVQCLE
jgi:molybdopterin biosynthesis enzyme MoaB